MRQQRVQMPMPSLAVARAIEATHEHLGSPASALGRSPSARRWALTRLQTTRSHGYPKLLSGDRVVFGCRDSARLWWRVERTPAQSILRRNRMAQSSTCRGSLTKIRLPRAP